MFLVRILCLIMTFSMVACGGGGSSSSSTPGGGSGSPTATSTTVVADFSSGTDAPLLKTKIGVYQTPFMGTKGLNALTTMGPFLREAGVRDLRYEMGWGKPDTFAYDQITGVASSPIVDFSHLDPFVNMLKQHQVQPLFAMTYDPLPMQTCDGWQCWKGVPNDMNGWQSVIEQYVSHYETLGIGAYYEMWNEPDMPGDGAKMFFTGGPAEYGQLYKYGSQGLQQAGMEAKIGGPSIAYDTTYLTQSGITALPMDFASIHGYANYSTQIQAMRSALGSSHVPIFMTEYGSYSSNSLTGDNSKHAGAVRFFADVSAMLSDYDVPKVYWAQWIDDSIGMITYDLHRKAIFNAYKIYQSMLPADRFAVTISGASPSTIGSMAGGDDHKFGVVIWNTSTSATNLVVKLNDLPFTSGKGQVWYIDANHASYQDGGTENLTQGSDGSWTITANYTQWEGMVQGESVVYIEASDTSTVSLLADNPIGKYRGSGYWFGAHPSPAYADFDPRTSIARLGMGDSDKATALVGNIYDVNDATKLAVTVSKSGSFTSVDENSLFGIRIDFQNDNGVYDYSVLYTDGLFSSVRTFALPWGTKSILPDRRETWSGSSFIIDLDSVAPGNWNGHRITITPILQNAGKKSRARVIFRIAS